MITFSLYLSEIQFPSSLHFNRLIYVLCALFSPDSFANISIGHGVVEIKLDSSTHSQRVLHLPTAHIYTYTLMLNE